ncbi:MAG: LytTR family transcriptional regulator DNA-binding domain-containing protein, partial [Eggerthellaceae bacterium]|nr:LytTR family transcriptional regulator DNA-binding domain-containing protein [Eggerthellaceae bacterium]MBQ9067542.1 LytTR family transcriptional regulator DNA-binding domain-containing protein [Eggerthellaceae bacterium]
PKGYQVRAFRYLLKGDGMRRALEVCLDDCYQEVYATNELYELVDASHARIQVRLRDVIYIEGMRKRHVRTHMVGKPQPVECLGTLASHEKALAEHGFLRIQNSFLVNMEHIRDMRNYSVILDDGETLRASRSRFMQVAAHYALWRGRQL